MGEEGKRQEVVRFSLLLFIQTIPPACFFNGREFIRYMIVKKIQ